MKDTIKGLQSYFSVIDPHLLNHVTGKPGEFIRIFREQKYLTEKAFRCAVCGSRHKDNYYRDLKSRTLKILQALAIISTPRAGSVVKKKFDECQKKFTIGQKLVNEEHRKEGLRLIKQAYKLAVTFDFSYIACECASILYHNHVYYDRNKKEATLYAEQVDKHLEDYRVEKKAEHWFFQIAEYMNHPAKLPNHLSHIIDQIRPYSGRSVKYKFYEASFHILYGLHSGQHELIIKWSTSVLDYFKNKQGAFPGYYYFFLIHQGIAQIAMKRYIAANDSFKVAEQYTKNKPYNYYLLKYYETLNALHSRNYWKAYELYQQFKKCRIDSIREQFSIVEGYLCFLSYTKHLKLNRPFRLGKYLNETFKAQADKQGDNINIIIAELLVYLVRDRGRFIDRVEAVEHYSYKHLKNKDNQRAKWFLKILCLLPKVNFHYLALERRVKRLIQQLQKQPLRMGDGFAVEIIPYEQVLEIIMVQLGKKAA